MLLFIAPTIEIKINGDFITAIIGNERQACVPKP